MNVGGLLIRVLARCLEFVASELSRAAYFLRSLLPALLPPDQLLKQVRSSYDKIYDHRNIPTNDAIGGDSLDPWETDVLNRYKINSGRMLVMGSGWGREAIPIARRGVTVVAMETNPVAVRTAQRFVKTAGLSAWFHRADFTVFPYAGGSFDFAMLASGMYSAIPGVAGRHAWLENLGRQLRPGGHAILSFQGEYRAPSRRRAFRLHLNAILHKIPGANRTYQPGDDCSSGHYLHVFQKEEELRTELIGAGAHICELHWVKGYAIVTFSARQARELIS
jgi:SAM-dependent methyltransferase